MIYIIKVDSTQICGNENSSPSFVAIVSQLSIQREYPQDAFR